LAERWLRDGDEEQGQKSQSALYEHTNPFEGSLRRRSAQAKAARECANKDNRPGLSNLYSDSPSEFAGAPSFGQATFFTLA
jgi:hypothetical protein